MLVQPAERVYRTWIIDSRRWDQYRPRPTDFVIATYPKRGTNGIQRIIALAPYRPRASITPDPVHAA